MGILIGCRATPSRTAQFGGNTMGTTYQVTYAPAEGSVVDQARVEELLAAINQSLSTYIDSSVISKVNGSGAGVWVPVDAHFETVFRRARTIYEDTSGAFNPAVGPLVHAWGFGPDGPQSRPDDDSIRALLEIASFKDFDLRPAPPAVRKQFAGAKLDFNAIGEGYAIDAIAALLEREGVANYLIEIGGDVRAHGHRPDGRPWRVGIEKPAAGALATRTIRSVILLQNAALGTSGIYRNYRILDGKRIAHILNPRTGYPEMSSLQSVTALAPDAITADAYATAFMVMGVDDAMRFVGARSDLEAYFLIRDDAGRVMERSSVGFPKAEE